MLRSVRAQVGQWLPERPIPGFYAAFLEFEDGAPATISHNGYGYFLGAELVPWGQDRQRYTAEERAAVRQALRAGTRAETEEKQAMGIAERRAELEELYEAVVLGKPLWHDGRWGMATLEVCLAIMESARQRQEVRLQRQVPVPR